MSLEEELRSISQGMGIEMEETPSNEGRKLMKQEIEEVRNSLEQ